MTKPCSKNGFTLIEILIATSIFLVVATVSVTSLLASSKSVRKIQSDREVHQAARIAFEQMSRDIRHAKAVACQQAGDLSNCNSVGAPDPRVATDYLQICAQDGTTRREYGLSSSTIQVREQKSTDPDWGDWSDITSSSVFAVGQSANGKLFQLYPSHNTNTANTCTAGHSTPMTIQPFVELSAEFRNFSDPDNPPPPEKQSKITLRTMVSLRNFIKQY